MVDIFDIKIFYFINKITNIGYLPYFLLFLSKICDISNFVFYYIILFLLLIFFSRKVKNAQKEYFLLNYKKLVEIGCSYAFIGLLYGFLKFFINAKRPFCSLPSSDFISVANLGSERCLSGFPSSHISIAFLISYYLWGYTRNKYQEYILASFVILVGISRITLAMHFPMQLIISLLIAYAVIRTSKRFCKLADKIIVCIGNWIYRKVCL
jgi:membrane-associated phospholipid phosphatase